MQKGGECRMKKKDKKKIIPIIVGIAAVSATLMSIAKKKKEK